MFGLAAVESGEAPAGIVHPRRQGERTGQPRDHAHHPPLPGDMGRYRHARRRNAETLADFLQQLRRHRGDYGRTGTWRRPSDSSRPNIIFMFCTAWPEAPLTRLSMTESATRVSPP